MANLDQWKQLLAMSTKVTETENSENFQKDLKDMQAATDAMKGNKAENMQFLELAMREAVGGQEGPCLFTQFFLLGGDDPETLVDSPAKIAAAKELADQLEDYLLLGNFAEQFQQASGLKALANLTCSKNEEIRLLYLRLVPQLAENRLAFQEMLVDSPVFEKYLQMLDDYKTMKPAILLALLSAISAIIRGSKPAFLKFHKARGTDKVLTIVKLVEDDKCAVRAAYLLWSINESLSDADLGYTGRYPEENDVTEEEYSDEEALYREFKNSSNLKKSTTQKKRKTISNRIKSKKPIGKDFKPLVELRNVLFSAYLALKDRIPQMEMEREEVGEEDFDEAVYEFAQETFQKIRSILLRVDHHDVLDKTKTLMADFLKTSNRAKKQRGRKVKLTADPVAKRFDIRQWYSRDEMFEIFKASDKDIKNLTDAVKKVQLKK
ncbi:Protein CBG10339 [Caenorhabditis briggsae]|uniref:Uncharacterized protein n=3 Tax=Caenorhabditis briggsae TaxID=6238 RepID=A0AAE9DMW5_CAEBR|nr:Protein CBG10339 [Caenorhabditis briggsae]ULU08326.1 hypothetical protein L3Y34_019470 [Caenorhabditis briggsae]CAP29664.2 Protein CBG10339 [Caenorhabditis briggsae]